MKEEDKVIMDIRLFASITSMFPTICLTSFLLSLMIGTIYLGHVPIAHLDGDLYSINLKALTFLYFLNLIITAFSFIAVPSWILLITQIWFEKIKITKKEVVFHLIAAFSCMLFLFFKYELTYQFEWFYD